MDRQTLLDRLHNLDSRCDVIEERIDDIEKRLDIIIAMLCSEQSERLLPPDPEQ